MENSKIEWTDCTFNPWIGCSKVHAGCTNCYAEELMDHRYHKVQWGPHGTRQRTSDANWKQPLKWDREAREAGERRRVFCASLADVFEDWQGTIVDSKGEEIWRFDGHPKKEYGRKHTMADMRDDLFHLIDRTPNLDWLLLTKRPENVLRMWPKHAVPHPMPNYRGQHDRLLVNKRDNVWLGTSVSDQATAEAAIPHLLECGRLCSKLFLSIEPLLGPVDLEKIEAPSGLQHSPNGGLTFSAIHRQHEDRYFASDHILNWIIIGGESGPNARPCDLKWIRDIVEQCKEAGVPCFVKQLGACIANNGYRWFTKDKKGGDPDEWPEELRVREFPESSL